MTSIEPAAQTDWLTIAPSPPGVQADLWDLWRHRQILHFFVWRDVKIRYKQTTLGVAWAILQPLAGMAVFGLFFGIFAGFAARMEGQTYALHVFSGLLVWLFFSNAVSGGMAALVSSAPLVTKIYFPRSLIPLAAVGVAGFDFLVSLLGMVVLMVIYRSSGGVLLLLAPVALAGTVLAAAGVGLLFSAVAIRYRDFRHVVPFFLQLWLFITPVVYPAEIVPPRWQWVLLLNPLAGLIEGFRGAVLGTAVSGEHLGWALTEAVGLFLLGASFFRTVERRLADII